MPSRKYAAPLAQCVVTVAATLPRCHALPHRFKKGTGQEEGEAHHALRRGIEQRARLEVSMRRFMRCEDNSSVCCVGEAGGLGVVSVEQVRAGQMLDMALIRCMALHTRF